ncbi:MAG: SH3 domain-containing protein [Planctomycetes bacterium]|nr:SH3 domain-containing protein [Planctomycetota bacterium]
MSSPSGTMIKEPYLKNKIKHVLLEQERVGVLASAKELCEFMQALKYHNPLKELCESLRAFQYQDPLKGIRESMKPLYLQFQNFIRPIDTLTSVKELNDSIQAFKYRDQLKELHESLRPFQYQDPLKDIRESMQTLQLQFQNFIKPIGNSINALQSSLKNTNLKQVLDSISRDNWPLAYEVDGSDILVDGNGTISVATESISKEALQDIVNQVTESAFEHAGNKLDIAVSKIVYEIQSLKDPFIQKILTWFIFPIIVGIILSIVKPISDYYLRQSFTIDKRVANKEINRRIQVVAKDKSYLASFRFVTEDTLDVRKKGNRKSKIVGYLYFGQVVEIIEKGRRWTLVKWTDAQGVTIQGWVYTRYLQRFK